MRCQARSSWDTASMRKLPSSKKSGEPRKLQTSLMVFLRKVSSAESLAFLHSWQYCGHLLDQQSPQVAAREDPTKTKRSTDHMTNQWQGLCSSPQSDPPLPGTKPAKSPNGQPSVGKTQAVHSRTAFCHDSRMPSENLTLQVL